MFGPSGSHLLISREVTSGCRCLRGCDCGPLYWGQRDRCLVVIVGQAEHDASDAILRIGRQMAGGIQSVVEQSRHKHIVTALRRK
jgi:hypothetical protein